MVGDGTKIWHQAQVMDGAQVGGNCTLGKGVFIGKGAEIGNLVKIGNYVSVFTGLIEDEVQLGPHSLLIEDQYPRATTLDGTRKERADWTTRRVHICFGASIGGGAIILPGVRVGRFAMVAAGSVVHRDVPDHTTVAGNPARQIGLTCRCGFPLGTELVCTQCARSYIADDEGRISEGPGVSESPTATNGPSGT